MCKRHKKSASSNQQRLDGAFKLVEDVPGAIQNLLFYTVLYSLSKISTQNRNLEFFSPKKYLPNKCQIVGNQKSEVLFKAGNRMFRPLQ